MRKVSGFTIIEWSWRSPFSGSWPPWRCPGFFDIQNDARRASAAGVAGAVASGAAINYGARLAQGNLAGAATIVNLCTTANLSRVVDRRVSRPTSWSAPLRPAR